MGGAQGTAETIQVRPSAPQAWRPLQAGAAATTDEHTVGAPPRNEPHVRRRADSRLKVVTTEVVVADNTGDEHC